MIDKLLTIWNAISGSIQQEVNHIDKLLTIWNAISGYN